MLRKREKTPEKNSMVTFPSLKFNRYLLDPERKIHLFKRPRKESKISIGFVQPA